MVPKKDLDQLIEHYKGEITENAQLNKAATLAAEKHLWLKSGLPPAIINANIKPMGRELTKLTKRIRQGDVGAGAPPEEEPDLVTGPVEQWVKKMIKGTPATPQPPIPSQQTKASKPRRQLPSRPDSKPEPKKRKKTEVEKLKPLPGWQDWAEGRKLRGRLDYESD